MKKILLLVLFPASLLAQTIPNDGLLEVRKWREQSLQVKIYRDQWGIAHVYGKTDADAVFGMVYAQCEDDFNRVERNYLTATGRLAEALGEDYVYHDLRTRLFQDSVMAMGYYKQSPEWLKTLPRFCGWHQLLSLHTSRNNTQTHQTLSTVDALPIQRGKHWR
jgi:acyl-homoserine-lactone acylase